MNLFTGIQKILKYAAEGYREGLEGTSSKKPKRKPLTPKRVIGKVVDEPIEEVITVKATTEEIVSHICDWSVNRINEANLNYDDAKAIFDEFEEWIEPENGEINVFTLDIE